MYLQGPAGSIHESWPHLVIWPLPTLKMWSLYKVAEKSTPAKSLLRGETAMLKDQQECSPYQPT